MYICPTPLGHVILTSSHLPQELEAEYSVRPFPLVIGEDCLLSVAWTFIFVLFFFFFKYMAWSSHSFLPPDISAIQESQLTALQDVTGILLSFIHSNPEAWAPVVSTVSLTHL